MVPVATHGNRRYAMVSWHLNSNLHYIFSLLTKALESVSADSEDSVLAGDQEKSLEALSRDLQL